MDIPAILTANYPGRQFSVGDTYESIKALDGGDIPPLAELETAWPQIQYDRAMQTVEKQRSTAYREKADPLFFKYQAGEATEQEWQEARQAVRDRYPYPEETA